MTGDDACYGGTFAKDPAAQLVILPNRVKDDKETSGATLCYKVELLIEDGTNATANHQYFIDAHNGIVVWHYDALPHDITTGVGDSLYDGQVSLTTTLTGSTFFLQDQTRGGNNVVPEYLGMIVTDMQNQTSGRGTIFTDADNVWGNFTTSDRQSAGVDAHYGAEKTYDYYRSMGRTGIDDQNYQLVSRVHYGVNYNNAFWDGTQMTYGDGDGSLFSPLVSLDVAGHEITHGLTERTANLIYSGESGGANEAFSDIFGTAVEFSVGCRPNGRCPNYKIGEDIYMEATPRFGFHFALSCLSI